MRLLRARMASICLQFLLSWLLPVKCLGTSVQALKALSTAQDSVKGLQRGGGSPENYYRRGGLRGYFLGF